jgi:integrase/recombinase XerD
VRTDRVDPLTAKRAHIAAYVRRVDRAVTAIVLSLDSGSGLSNSTIQQRLVPV